jgi:hypothetical protein
MLHRPGRRSRDSFNCLLHYPIAAGKKIEMWENALNHYCSDHFKCDHPAHQRYQWKNRDIPETQATLRGCLVEVSKIIQNVDALTGSIQADKSFHAVKGKYTDKRLNFTTSTEARFPLGVIS